MTRIPPQILNGLKSRIDSVTSRPHGVPGLVVAVVDRNGDVVFEHASGTRGVDTNEPMTPDTVFWIASCTKMIVAIAAMQLVERGTLALDDVALVERLAPELRDVKVLQEGADGRLELVDKKQGITLRMLLSHTGQWPYSLWRILVAVCVRSFLTEAIEQPALATPSSTPRSRNGPNQPVSTSFQDPNQTSCSRRW